MGQLCHISNNEHYSLSMRKMFLKDRMDIKYFLFCKGQTSMFRVYSPHCFQRLTLGVWELVFWELVMLSAYLDLGSPASNENRQVYYYLAVP